MFHISCGSNQTRTHLNSHGQKMAAAYMYMYELYNHTGIESLSFCYTLAPIPWFQHTVCTSGMHMDACTCMCKRSSYFLAHILIIDNSITSTWSRIYWRWFYEQLQHMHMYMWRTLTCSTRVTWLAEHSHNNYDTGSRMSMLLPCAKLTALVVVWARWLRSCPCIITHCCLKTLKCLLWNSELHVCTIVTRNSYWPQARFEYCTCTFKLW